MTQNFTGYTQNSLNYFKNSPEAHHWQFLETAGSQYIIAVNAMVFR
jgi:hypothetical protein